VHANAWALQPPKTQLPVNPANSTITHLQSQLLKFNPNIDIKTQDAILSRHTYVIFAKKALELKNQLVFGNECTFFQLANSFFLQLYCNTVVRFFHGFRSSAWCLFQGKRFFVTFILLKKTIQI